MKKILLLGALFIAHQAFALDICKFEDTTELYDLIEAKKVVQLRESDDHKKFTKLEKKLIHSSIKAEGYHGDINEAQALRIFGDYYDENDTELGSNAGSIAYLKAGNYQFVYVRYWPGDNEVGAFFETKKTGEFKMIATVSDQWITCTR